MPKSNLTGALGPILTFANDPQSALRIARFANGTGLVALLFGFRNSHSTHSIHHRGDFMLPSFVRAQHLPTTFKCVGAFVVCETIAGVIGLNKPVGLTFAFVGVIALVLAVTFPWRTTKPYRNLFLYSLAGFVVFAVLHNAMDAFAGMTSIIGLHESLLGLSVVAFFLAVLVCPATLLVGMIGWPLMMFTLRNQRT